MRQQDEQMRGSDEDTGEYLGPSRGEERREALAVRELAFALVEQPYARLQQIPAMSEDLLAAAAEAQRITSHIARKRACGFLAKKLRREDEETLAELRAAVEHDKGAERREAAALHRIEALRDQLIDDGDEALAQLMAEYPQADRQHLRQLARNAREERLKNKPPHAFRELFRELRALLDEPSSGDSSDS
jgi:ribosome-associated protein